MIQFDLTKQKMFITNHENFVTFFCAFYHCIDEGFSLKLFCEASGGPRNIMVKNNCNKHEYGVYSVLYTLSSNLTRFCYETHFIL